MTERSRTAVCLAVACEPSTLLKHFHSEVYELKDPKHDEQQSNYRKKQGQGQHTHRFFSFRMNSLTKDCTSGMVTTTVTWAGKATTAIELHIIQRLQAI